MSKDARDKPTLPEIKDEPGMEERFQRLTVARERLRNSPSVFMHLQSAQREAVLSYDGPEVAGSMRSRRHHAV